MIVFIRSVVHDEIRELMFNLCWRAWANLGATVVTLDRHGVELPNYHMDARRHADRVCGGGVFVFADDDALPIGRDFLRRGESIIREHPEFGILQARDVTVELSTAALEVDGYVSELHAVGGCCFVRKGMFEDLPNCPPHYDDVTVDEHIKKLGFKTGVLRTVLYNHIGLGYSRMPR